MNRLLKKVTVFFLAVMTIVSFSTFAIGCRKDPPPVVQTPANFTLNYHLKNLSLYETLKLKVEDFGDITWSSDNQNVASVENGLVTAKSYGTANITATSGTYTDTCIINVINEGKVPAIRINVDDAGFNLLTGDTYALDCSIRYNGQTFSDGEFTFASSAPEVLSVNSEGVITANKLGEAIITVVGSWRDFDSIYLTKYIPVSVIPDISMELSILDEEIFTMAGEVEGIVYKNTTTLSYNINVDGQSVTSSSNITWVVSDENIVTVGNDSKVTAKNRGTTQIYYEYTLQGKTYKSLPVSISVNAPKKTVKELVIYEIGEEDFIPNALFDGEAYSVKMKVADYTNKVDFASDGLYIDVDTQNGFVGKEIIFTVDTTLYSYSVNVLFVTHDIATLLNLLSF